MGVGGGKSNSDLVPSEDKEGPHSSSLSSHKVEKARRVGRLLQGEKVINQRGEDQRPDAH